MLTFPAKLRLISREATVQSFNFCTSQPGVCQWLVMQTPMDIISKIYPKHMNDLHSLRSMLRSVSRLSMYPCPGKWLSIGYVVMYYARIAHAFSARIKCRHCSCTYWSKAEYLEKPTPNPSSLESMPMPNKLLIQYQHLLPAPVDVDICQCLVAQNPWMKCQKLSQALNDHVVCDWNLRSFVRSSIHPCPDTGWQSGVRSCIMLELSTHLVQELNVGTVNKKKLNVFVTVDHRRNGFPRKRRSC